jgi:regulator of RNase E activity RraA
MQAVRKAVLNLDVTIATAGMWIAAATAAVATKTTIITIAALMIAEALAMAEAVETAEVEAGTKFRMY